MRQSFISGRVFASLISLTAMLFSSCVAADSMLRISCDGADTKAEIYINDVFKGECPLDIAVHPGNVRLKVTKSVDATRDRIYEDEFRIGDTVAKRIEVVLGAPQLNAEGKRVEAERRRAEAERQRQAAEATRAEEAALQNRIDYGRQMQVQFALQLERDGMLGSGKSFKDCDLCPEMVWIPPGRMSQRPPVNDLIKWLNQVSFEYPLAVGKFEVTYDQWDACTADGECRSNVPEGVTKGFLSDTRWGRGRMPVISISRKDMETYFGWLKKKTGHAYRLLSRTEFVYAARAGRNTAYPWGDDVGTAQANCSNCGSDWDRRQTAPVGSFKPNAWGLHDMVGNAAEMVADCGSPSFDKAPTNGAPVNTGCHKSPGFNQTTNVVLGGDWLSPLQGGIPTSESPEGVFFRVAFALPVQGNPITTSCSMLSRRA